MEDESIEVNTDSYHKEVNLKNEPSYTSPEWSDYVLSVFASDETDTDGHPYLTGLRRVTEKLLGNVLNSYVETIQQLGNGILCKYTIEIEWCKDEVGLVDEIGRTHYPVRKFTAVADAHSGNVDDGIFQNYFTTVAESRAEARAYRKALQLKVVAKDEICKKNQDELNSKNKSYDSNKMTLPQKTMIQAKCLQFDIDVEKFAQQSFSESFEKLSKKQALDMIKQFDAYQKEPKTIPEEIKKVVE